MNVFKVKTVTGVVINACLINGFLAIIMDDATIGEANGKVLAEMCQEQLKAPVEDVGTHSILTNEKKSLDTDLYNFQELVAKTEQQIIDLKKVKPKKEHIDTHSVYVADLNKLNHKVKEYNETISRIKYRLTIVGESLKTLVLPVDEVDLTGIDLYQMVESNIFP